MFSTIPASAVLANLSTEDREAEVDPQNLAAINLLLELFDFDIRFGDGTTGGAIEDWMTRINTLCLSLVGLTRFL